MSGARVPRDVASQPQIEYRPQGELHLVPTDGELSEMISFRANGTTQNDPNESFELRDLIRLAITYFDRGMVDDAEELLNEALDAGYSRPDAIDLLRRVRNVRGQTVLVTQSPEVAERARISSDVVVHEFTVPLPGADAQPALVRHSIEDADQDLAAGRLHSAHDATLQALALAPAYLPNYFRLAELRVALDDPDGAKSLIASLRAVLDVIGDDSDWLTQSMQVTLDPEDLDALVRLARSLVALEGSVQLDPYVPDAIERSLLDRPDVALELAREYVRLRPTSREAERLHSASSRCRRRFGPDSRIVAARR